MLGTKMPEEHFALSNQTMPIYRFVSFFELYDLLVHSRLRLSKLSTFPDKNEGIGHILHMQDHVLFRSAHIDETRIVSLHEGILENHYLSCWSKEPDLISMWSLYSPDCAGIRISTTVGKLFSTLKGCYEKYEWGNSMDRAGSREIVSWSCALEPVSYVDFFERRDAIRAKYQEFYKSVGIKVKQDKNYLNSPEGFEKDFNEFVDYRNNIIGEDGSFLKDIAYRHEGEVRAVLYCGVRDDAALEEWRQGKNLFAAPFKLAKAGELADYISATAVPSFVDSVCFDPRMPTFKRRVFEDILGTFLPSVSESRAFGYFLEVDSFASSWEGYPVKS